MSVFSEMAELLFPNISKTPADYFAMYPARDLPEGACVTRFAPSPTGFLHIGGLYTSLACERTAHLSGGKIFLRIEDTDKKREIADGVSGIIDGLNAFGIEFDEGVTLDGESGVYGPYTQSLRGEIYQSFAKALVAAGRAYPCFMTEDELAEIRAQQEKNKEMTGCYGKYARYRDITVEQARELIAAGREFAVRLYSKGTPDGRISFVDGIKGKIEMAENITDVIILKSDGMPTYHFAHVVDDTLMHVRPVIRADEWIASFPIHFELFSALKQIYPNDVELPEYAHPSPILKEDNGGKRKISKRKDPEASVSYFIEEGYPVSAVREYLMTLLNSDFEEWRAANPDKPLKEFPFSISKMSPSGALFDLRKLDDISKTIISRMTAEQVCDAVLTWAKAYDSALYDVIGADRDKLTAIFSIDRGGPKPRKDLSKWKDVRSWISFFYDDMFEGYCPLPEKVDAQSAEQILAEYKKTYDPRQDKDQWFASVKNICEPLGYSPDVKSYKKQPELFKGHVGDVSTVIRIGVTGRTQTPDLCAVCKILGKDKVFARIDRFIQTIK